MNRNFHKVCEECKRCFAFENASDSYCNQCKTIKQVQATCKPNFTCRKCQRKSYSPMASLKFRNLCQLCAVSKYGPGCRSTQSIEKYNEQQNQSWAQRKEKKQKYCSLPLDVLNQIEERKRVFDEKHAEKYIRGKAFGGYK